MPGRPHHTEKFKRCVEEVMAKGNEESSAYAICTASFQEAGNEIFEPATRHLHLRGAVGQVRTTIWEGREHLLVPVVALMEGVIHAMNAEHPEFVPQNALEAAQDSWNGRPLMLGHPTRNGKQISAYEPGVMEKFGFGFVRQAEMIGSRLSMLALVDPEKLVDLGQEELLRDLRAGKPIEVSVGAYVRTATKEGDFKGKKYKAEWLEIYGDHLAFLPKGIGACSMDMGCGANRAAMLVTAEEFKLLEEAGHEFHGNQYTGDGKSNYHGGERVTYGGKKGYTYQRNYGKKTIVVQFDDGSQKELPMGKLTRFRPKDLEEHIVTLEDSEVGNWVEDRIAELTDEIRTAIGARNSAKDLEMIQTVHDHAVQLGAACKEYREGAAAQPQPRAACGCNQRRQGENNMGLTKEKRAEIIAALVTDKHSGFKEGDEPFLETAADDRLTEFKAAAENRKTQAEAHEKLENEKISTDAKNKVLEDRLKTAEQKPTKEQWLEQAPDEIRDLLDRQRAADDQKKDELVTALKTAQSEYTEDELKAMSIPDLERMQKLVGKPAPNYAGRAIPQQRDRVAPKPKQTPQQQRAAATTEEENFTPPDPYEAGLKTLRAQMGKTVN